MYYYKGQPYDLLVTLETTITDEMDTALNQLVALTGTSKRSLVIQALLDFLHTAGVLYAGPTEAEPTPRRTAGRTRAARTTERGEPK